MKLDCGLKSDQCGIETGFLIWWALLDRRLKSDQCGIETSPEADYIADALGSNRTNVGLKLVAI